MIRFCCEQCGHKIGVEDGHTSKRGRCPECGEIFVVPPESTIVDFNCADCGRRISTPKIHAGRKVICPKCRNTLIVPAGSETLAESVRTVCFTCSMCHREIEEPESSRGKLVECPHCSSYVAAPLAETPAREAEAFMQPGTQDDASEERFEQMQKTVGTIALQEPEPVVERKLPWILDIFLYPASRPGLMILGIVVVVRVTFRIVVRFLGTASQQFLPFLAFFGFMWAVGMLVRIVLVLYLWWYLCECIRESAAGVIRAPETTGRSPGLGGMLWQALMTGGCFLFFLGPALFYYTKTRATDAVFWGLVVYAVIFFPMSFLGVVVFESWQGLNPILLSRAIFSTFLSYCAMIVVIAAFAAVGVFTVRKLPDPQQSSLGLFILWCMSIYLAMVVAHLLGAFCYRYKEKLNWDV